MKFKKLIYCTVIMFVCLLSPAHGQPISDDPDRLAMNAQETGGETSLQDQYPKGREYNADGASAVIETLLVRPLGLVSVICGTGLFIGMSPLTALATIPAPHDAFQKTAEALIVAPGEYTFKRPMGDFGYRSKR